MGPPSCPGAAALSSTLVGWHLPRCTPVSGSIRPRDFTGQVPLKLEQPVVRNFYLQADVELTEGPQDGFCGLLFGWKGNEHWYAMKVGQIGLQVTQDPGHLPHTRIAGTTPILAIPAFKADSFNQLSLLARDGFVQFYVNDQLVERAHIDDTTGQVFLGAQAANSPDLLRCAFDHVRLRGVALAHSLLGGLNLDAYCQSQGYAKSILTNPQAGSDPGSDAARNNWACTSGGSPQLVDIDGACRWQYDRGDAVAWAGDDHNPSTWLCYTST